MDTIATTHTHGHDDAIGNYVRVTSPDEARSHLVNVHSIGSEVMAHDMIHNLGAEVDTLAAEVESLSRRLSDESSRAIAATRDLESFKVQVRDLVIDAKDRHSLCDEGTNWFLTTLGLDPLSREYAVRLSRSVTEYATAYVTAADEDDASDRAIEMARDLDWEPDSYSMRYAEVEVEEVEEA